MRGDMAVIWLASTFCGLDETVWQLMLEGDMSARQTLALINAILLCGVSA
ncbi:hypothetical protein [Streptomyces longisporus]|uniref:Uncharacterized protein n=1 Tax=Streptomyces longisporus TaxID=1948 RepID=A0ABN3LL40_STRLO